MFYYFLYPYNKVRSRKENVTKKNPKEEEIHRQYCIWGENVCISGPAQFKPILFKGQLYNIVLVCGVLSHATSFFDP